MNSTYKKFNYKLVIPYFKITIEHDQDTEDSWQKNSSINWKRHNTIKKFTNHLEGIYYNHYNINNGYKHFRSECIGNNHAEIRKMAIELDNDNRPSETVEEFKRNISISAKEKIFSRLPIQLVLNLKNELKDRNFDRFSDLFTFTKECEAGNNITKIEQLYEYFEFLESIPTDDIFFFISNLDLNVGLTQINIHILIRDTEDNRLVVLLDQNILNATQKEFEIILPFDNQ